MPTSIIVTSFSDRLFVAVSQINKLGTLTLASTQVVRANTQIESEMKEGMSDSHSLAFLLLLLLHRLPAARLSPTPSPLSSACAMHRCRTSSRDGSSKA